MAPSPIDHSTTDSSPRPATVPKQPWQTPILFTQETTSTEAGGGHHVDFPGYASSDNSTSSVIANS